MCDLFSILNNIALELRHRLRNMLFEMVRKKQLTLKEASKDLF